MWILFAFGSALFAGLTAVLAKIGVSHTNSDLATAIRAVVILLFSWMIVVLTGGELELPALSFKTWLFLILSGLATGASWLCYFRALQLGDINKVVPVDKSSIVLTVFLALIFFGDSVSVARLFALTLIGIGTYLMIEKKKTVPGTSSSGYAWLVYAFLSAGFASLTSILGKIGIDGVNSNLGTAIRTIVVLIMAWLLVAIQGRLRALKEVDNKSWLFLIASGVTTGLSWLCYYRALKDGVVSVVVPIDKLSIVVAVALSYLILGETLTRRSFSGLFLIVLGTMGMIFF